MITLVEQSKNSVNLTEENRINSPIINDVDIPIENISETIDTYGTPFTEETKNTITLTEETKV